MKKKLKLLALFLAFCFFANAQVDLHNTGTLYISSGTDTLFINGNFTNTSAAAFTNNGRFYIKQNITNDQASITIGTGILFFNGSIAQTLSGSQPFNTYDFNTNNASGITLNTNLSISGTHTFSSGIITPSATPNYLIYEAGSSHAGSGDTKHVNGWVKKMGSTDFIFPVGNGTYLRPVTLESLSGSSEFNVKYNATTPNASQMQLPIQSMNLSEYWEINKVSGGSASVHLNWNNSKVGFRNYVLADIAAAWYNGSNWTDQGGTATGNVTTTGDVTSGSVSSFGYFAIGSKSISLPVNFLSFTAQRKNNYSDLKWITDEEINTDHYEVLRSDDGTSFISLSSVPTTNRLTVQEYTYKDYGALNGIAFYRIRCVDRDGRYKLSKIVAVYDRSYLSNNIQVLNPATDAIVIRSRMDENQPSSFALYNMAGKEILKGSIQLRVGAENVIWLPFKPAHGMYILKLSGQGKESVHKTLID